MVSKNIEIVNFRYITKIKTHNKELLQVSSEIKGKLPENWKNDLGNILLKLLPAGSVSGAPKQKTLEIINENGGSGELLPFDVADSEDVKKTLGEWIEKHKENDYIKILVNNAGIRKDNLMKRNGHL